MFRLKWFSRKNEFHIDRKSDFKRIMFSTRKTDWKMR